MTQPIPTPLNGRIRMLRTFCKLAMPLLFLALPLSGARGAGPPDVCERVTVSQNAFIVCTIDLRRFQVRTFWRAPDGQPIGSFLRLAELVGAGRLAFAMNGGMYDRDRSPVGLYVEEGQQLKRANTANGPGNFHLKPNGVFFVKGYTAGVVETSRYLKQRTQADFATQSGPMLVIDGKIHPKFSVEGVSRKIRNGVGIRNKNTVVFAISEGAVSFGDFASLFRDELGCANALFLDGTVSSVYAPALNKTSGWLPMGPIVAAMPR